MDGVLTRMGGAVLMLVFAWFMWRVVRKAIEHPEEILSEDFKPIKVWLALIMILGGLAGLVGGAHLIVPSATNIAQAWGISQAVIGLTIVALGTSLPELATSAVAAYKKNSDIALGNVLGSNIFNVFFVLSISSMIHPLPAYTNIYIDLAIVALGIAIVMLASNWSKKKVISRSTGFVLLAVYAMYLIWVISGH
jgi:cation:H+ antiporter